MQVISTEVIYEDADVLVIDKPAGLNVHADGRTEEKTLGDWLLEHYPEMREVGEPFTTLDGRVFPRPGIVHRLDRDTSGVMILAKTPEAFTYLKEQFKEHKVKKEYLALVYGHVTGESGMIDTPIGKSKKDFRQREAGPESGGTQREARTVWEMKERYVDKAGHQFSLLHIRPETGRTHQIRAHMKSIGYPVTCDSLYARGRICVPPMTRHSLHAVKLSLTLPPRQGSGQAGEQKVFESPLRPDFAQALDSLTKV